MLGRMFNAASVLAGNGFQMVQGNPVASSIMMSVLNVGGTGTLNVTDPTAGKGIDIGTGTGTTATNAVPMVSAVNLLTGGTLVVPRVYVGRPTTGNPSNYVALNFNGGTLRALSGTLGTNATAFMNMTAAENAVVYAAGGTIDTNGQSIGISQALLAAITATACPRSPWRREAPVI